MFEVEARVTRAMSRGVMSVTACDIKLVPGCVWYHALYTRLYTLATHNHRPQVWSLVTQRGHYIFVKFLLGHAWNKTRWKQSTHLHLPATLNNVSNMGIWRITGSGRVIVCFSATHCGVRKSETDCNVMSQDNRRSFVCHWIKHSIWFWLMSHTSQIISTIHLL